ncbi:MULTISPECIES: ABC transporter permease [Brevibacterium]|nr:MULTISPECIES: ABC transporter permease [Brevibacterium]
MSPAMTAARASFTTAMGLVIEREVMVRLKSKAFMVSTLLGIVLLGALVAVSGSLPSLLDSTDRVAVTPAGAEAIADADGLTGDDTSAGAEASAGTGTPAAGAPAETEALGGAGDIELIDVTDAEEAKDLVRSGRADAAVVEDEESPVGLSVIAQRSAPESLVSSLSRLPTVELLDPDAPDPALTSLMGLGLGLVFFMSAVTFGSTIASSVVEEKQSRIVEILLASTSARALMFGKVIACTILAFGQIALTAVAILFGAAISGNDLVLGKITAPIAWFIPLFVIGFVMVAALYAAAASMVSRTEDLGSTSTPIMMIILVPYMAVVIFADNEAVMEVMSFIPFSAAVAVPMRVFLGTIEWWEPLVSLLILVVTTLGALLLATRIFERSILRSGPRLSWTRALRSQ